MVGLNLSYESSPVAVSKQSEVTVLELEPPYRVEMQNLQISEQNGDRQLSLTVSLISDVASPLMHMRVYALLPDETRLRLLPLDDDIVLFAGIPYPGRKLSSGPLEAFFVPKGTFVRLNPLIVHGTQFPVNADTAHVLCLLPGRTFMNDMTAETLPEEERIELFLPETVK